MRTEFKDGEKVVMGGIITEFKRHATKSGAAMAFMTVEDLYGSIEVIVFSSLYDGVKDFLAPEEVVVLTGKLQFKDGVAQIVADKITRMEMSAEDAAPHEQEYLGLIIPEERQKDLNEILDIAASYPGECPVIVAMSGKKYDAHTSVRRCEGLISELKNLLSDKDIIFFKKKQ